MGKKRSNADKSTGENCVFHVGNDDYKLSVKVNKSFLAARSSVFEKMFNGSFPQEDVVDIKDVTSEAFVIMLKFLRSEPYCFLSKQQAVDAMHAAEKYELLDLKKKCEDFLLPKSVEDVWWVAPHAYLYSSEVLQEAIRDLLSKHTSAFIFNEKFLEAQEELVMDVVQLDSVADVNELEIFKAVVEWAEYQLKSGGVMCDGKMLQQKLHNVLKYISVDALRSAQPALPHFLESKEVVELLRENERLATTLPVNSGGVTETIFLPRKATALSTVNGQKSPVDIVAHSLAEVDLWYSKKTLKDTVAVVQLADLVSVILPTNLVSCGSRSSHYLEDIQVSVSYSGSNSNGYSIQPQIYGSGYFKGVVGYCQDIHIPIKKSGEIQNMRISAAYPLKFTITVYFKGHGLYPWQSNRTFPNSNLLGSSATAAASCVKGYRFRPF